jgi:hypothetical protein
LLTLQSGEDEMPFLLRLKQLSVMLFASSFSLGASAT